MNMLTILDPLTDLTCTKDCRELNLPSNHPQKASKHSKMRKPTAMELFSTDRVCSSEENSLTSLEKAEQGKPESPLRKPGVVARPHGDYHDENHGEEIFVDELSLILLEDLNKESSREVAEALERLAGLCSHCEDAAVEACAMGAPGSVVSIMRKWSSSKVVQVKGFRVFIALAVGSTCSKVQKALWMVGGMQTTIEAMRNFPESQSIQFFGCNAILSLLPCGAGTRDSANANAKLSTWMGRRFVGQMQGVKTVISAMVQFEDDRTLQECGCSILLKLATFMHDEKRDRQMLLESGAVSAFSVALESHPQDEDIQNYTTMFMSFLASGGI